MKIKLIILAFVVATAQVSLAGGIFGNDGIFQKGIDKVRGKENTTNSPGSNDIKISRPAAITASDEISIVNNTSVKINFYLASTNGNYNLFDLDPNYSGTYTNANFIVINTLKQNNSTVRKEYSLTQTARYSIQHSDTCNCWDIFSIQ